MRSIWRSNQGFAAAMVVGALAGLCSTAFAENIKRMSGNFCRVDTNEETGLASAEHLDDGFKIVWSGENDEPAAICPFLSTQDLETGDAGNGDPIATNVDVTIKFGDEDCGVFQNTVTVKVCVAEGGSHACGSTSESNLACNEVFTIQSSGTDLSGWGAHSAGEPYVYVLATSTNSLKIAGYKVYN